ncbi:hypothetical protein OROGR_032109 [Orobanche gracilis]
MQEQQQHLMQMQPMMAAYYPTNVTTDLIQQYLDENKSLILKIVENQNSGKMSECAEFEIILALERVGLTVLATASCHRNQARLQRNLMYLAAIADSQPQPPTMHSQYPSGGVGGVGILPSGAHYMQQHQQAQQMSPQSLMAARSSMFYGAQPYPSLQQQQQQQASLHGQLGMSSGGSSGLMLQGDPHSAGQLGGGGFPNFFRGNHGNGQPSGSRGSAGGGKQGDTMSADGRGGSDGSETHHYLKGSAGDGN